MPFTNPPTAQVAVMTNALIDLLEDDTTLAPYFMLGSFGGRRILKDDPSVISKTDGRLLVITPIAERETDASFDDSSEGQRGSDEFRVTLAVVVYVYRSDRGLTEDEKILTVNLTGAVRDAIRDHTTGPNFLWWDIVHRGTEYDSGEYFRRSDSIFVMRGRYRKI
jgi:hypothetical protein